MKENTVYYVPRIALNWFEQADYKNPIHTTNSVPFGYNNRLNPDKYRYREALLE